MKSHSRNIDHLQENILYRFVGTNNITDVLNSYILYGNYTIYIQRLFIQNKFDLYAYLTLLKNNFKIE